MVKNSRFLAKRFLASKAAFTLVELLVVIGIIAILMGLLLPAVQMAREAARRTSCNNQVRQLTLAAVNFESAKGRFPAGYRNTAGPLQYSAWLLRTLPYVEQQNVYDQAVADDSMVANPIDNTVAHQGFAAVMNHLICPSSPAAATPAQDPIYGTAGNTTYLGVSGTDFTTRDGVMYVNSKTRAAEVRDGLSNTLLIGERPPSADHYFGWWYSGYGQNGSSSLDSLLGARERNIGSRGNAICSRGPFDFQPGSSDYQCSSLHFWSQHPGGANFSLADGSVKFTSYDAQSVVAQMATRNGKEVFQSPWE